MSHYESRVLPKFLFSFPLKNGNTFELHMSL
jgi:hypothetical protein